MDTKIIDGKSLALKHEQKLKQQVEKLRRPLKMVSFVNPDDSASLMFTKMKQKKATEVGIEFESIETTTEYTVEIITALIKEFNYDPKISGIMFQLPLSYHLASHQPYLLNLIRSDKDVDGLSTHAKFLSATVRGVFSILEDLDIGLLNKTVAVVGSEGSIGQTLTNKLIERGVEVIEVDVKNHSTSLQDVKHADIIISCTGVNRLIKPEMVKEGAILIDVGLGDFDLDCYIKASNYTPVKGGVGPMTVISLMENIVATQTV